VNCQRLVWDGACVTGSASGRLGPQPLLRVNSPGTIAGDYEVGLAQFGPSSFNVTGNLVLANDGSLPPNSPSNACEPLTNGAQIAGNIAVVDRGTCPFVVKVKNAQNAGAIAVVVVDTVPGCPPLGMGGVDPTITIPAVRLTNADGTAIKAQLAGGVNATLMFDPSQDAGTAEGKVLVYTPTAFTSGSSVSHWDISAEPSLLMEPAITVGLSSDPDLTVHQYGDIGWFGPGACGPLAVDPGRRTVSGVFLRAPYPNPTARGVTIGFRIARAEYVRLSIVDANGRAIRTLHAGMLAAGEHLKSWDGLTAARLEAAPGVYLVSLRTSEGVSSQRLAVSR
jgi:hypothetical protein